MCDNLFNFYKTISVFKWTHYVYVCMDLFYSSLGTYVFTMYIYSVKIFTIERVKADYI